MLRLFAVLNARLAHQRGGTLLSVIGIALGVALGFAVQLVNQAAVGELAAAARSLSGDADLQVRGGRSGFPETLYAELSRLPGIAVASPVLELDAGLAAAGRPLKLYGIDSLRAPLVQPALFADAPERRIELLKPDVLLVSASAAAALGVAEGGRVSLLAGLEAVEFEVAGVLPASTLRGVAALTDISTAQWRFDRLGLLNRIELRLAPGADRERVRERIAALLPPGVHVETVEAAEEASANLSRAYRVNLNVLALVALFTGGFLVFSAQSLEVTRRRPEHALLRVLGLRRRGVLRLVLLEAAAVGAAGSAAGIALGWLLAQAAVSFGGADLGAGMFRGMQPELAFPLAEAAGYFVAGVAIALAGAALPALEAAQVPAARALKAGDEQRMFARMVGVFPGLVLLVLSAALLALGPIDGVPIPGYASIACLLVGGILLMPWVFQALLARVPLPRAVPAALALAQLRGAPGQAMVSLASIVASFSLVAAMAIMVASFRVSVDRWLDAVLPADLYFRTTHAGETGWLAPEFEARVRALPQVARAEFVRSGRIVLDPRQPPISLIARDLAVPGVLERYPLVGATHSPGPDDPPSVWVSEAIADRYALRPGARMELPIEGKRHSFVVAGVWRDYARQHGAVVIERARYVALSGDRKTNDAALWLAPGATPAATLDALRALPGGELLEVAGPGEIRTVSLRIFDRTFAVTYALEAVAILVGLFGLSASMGAIVLARRREFGMLRHVGMTRGQIGAMLAAEGSLLALLGALAGLVLGTLISLILVFVVNRQSFHWSMDLHPPYALLGGFSLALVVLAALTAYFAGREAMGTAPVRAVREDW